MTTEHRWEVLDGDTVVLEVSDRPGILRSTAMLPPGMAPAQHSFLSATARSAVHEDRLRKILLASSDVEGFLAALRADGLTVRARNPEP
jgi:hypothetical protein